MVGKLEKADVRELFKHEARDFTTWLGDNIEIFNQQLGFNLSVQNREESVGGFLS